jgi:hypothetical protein
MALSADYIFGHMSVIGAGVVGVTNLKLECGGATAKKNHLNFVLGVSLADCHLK